MPARIFDSKGILPKVLTAIKLFWSLVSGGNIELVDLLFQGVPVLDSKHLECFHYIDEELLPS